MYCSKILYILKHSTHIKINFKNYSNMFRSHWTIIREHVFPISKLPLIVNTLHCGSAAACLCEVLGYVCVPLSMCILRC